jgi:hypothetical protein
MPLTPETEEFLKTWKPHYIPTQDDITATIQHFEAVYKVYNRLYNEVSARLGFTNRPDQKGATEHVVKFLSPDKLAGYIDGTEQMRNGVEHLKEFIRTHRYHFVLTGPHSVRSDIADDAILKDMESKDDRVRMEALLFLIYKIRCNIFHGQKHRTDFQLPLMRVVNPILELIVTKTEEKLRA